MVHEKFQVLPLILAYPYNILYHPKIHKHIAVDRLTGNQNVNLPDYNISNLSAHLTFNQALLIINELKNSVMLEIFTKQEKIITEISAPFW